MDREIKSLDDLKEGDIIRGYVKSCSDVGVFVRLVHVTLFLSSKNILYYFNSFFREVSETRTLFLLM